MLSLFVAGRHETCKRRGQFTKLSVAWITADGGVKYDHERGNLEENAINFLHYDEKQVE